MSLSIAEPRFDVVSEQDGVLTRAQAIAVFSEAHLRREVRNRRWQIPTRGVVLLHNGPPTPAQRHWIRLLACPPAAALAGPTALELDGFRGFEKPATFVTIPNGARRPRVGDLIAHWSIHLDERDVHPLRRPRRTRPARSLIDFASWSRVERYARAIILAGVQQRLTCTRDLREALTRRGPCRHRSLIVESYLDAIGGIQSLPEHDFDAIRVGRGLPPPTRQSPLRRADGRYYPSR